MKCSGCGADAQEGAAFCSNCGRSLGPEGIPADEPVAEIIPYRNAPALVGYYLGVFSLIPCLGLPLGIAALVLGILGLKKQREAPAARGKVHAWVAIILGSITTILWGGLLALTLVGALME